MKVGFYVVNDPQRGGGAFVVREDLAKAGLAAQGAHSICLLNQTASAAGDSISRQPSQARLLASRSLRKLGLSGTRKKARATKLKMAAIRHGVDILWFNHSDPIDIGLPFIYSVYDVQHRLQPWFPEVSANGLWESREKSLGEACRRASILTVPSEEAKADISFLFGVPKDRIYVLPFHTPSTALVEPKKGDVDIRAKYGLSRPYLFYPAQFWPHKNHINLLHAIHVLNHQRGVLMDLVLTGSDHGNLAYVKKTVSELGLNDFVHFPGFVSNQELVALYRQAHALIYVSYFGPENLPPLEALALGCPVVMGDIPGVRALYGEGPILVELNSPISIADGIEQVSSDPEQRESRIRRSRELIQANTAERYVENLFAILDDFAPIRRCWP